MKRKKLLLTLMLLTVSQIPYIERTSAKPLQDYYTIEEAPTLICDDIQVSTPQQYANYQYERPSRGDKLIEDAEQQRSTATDLEETEITEEVPEEEVDTWISLGVFKITAYCSCVYCCNKSDGITASGAIAEEDRTIAMYDVPLGTVLQFNGQDYIVEDRGTPYGHIDLYMNSHEQALQFGVQYTEVFMKTN